jgi:hypothetical protein
MTLTELEQAFRFQLTATEDYTPTDRLEYMTFTDQDKLTETCLVSDLETLVEKLKGFQLEGYRNRTPLFIIPETI